MKYGLDFGTTNSSISIEQNGKGKVLEIDNDALDARVIRTMLYFLRRELVISPKANQERVKNNIFHPGEISYVGKQENLIGQIAVNKYMEENKNRSEGVKRTIYTGRFIDVGSASVDQVRPDPVAEYYEEIDFGTGRLVQALKTALKSQFYKGTIVFGKFYSLEELISVFIKEVKKRTDQISGEDIKEVLCGRPVHFLDDPQKDKKAQDRLEKALKLAGFEKITFEFEPVAAARQFIQATDKKAQTVFVFDFGGGTLDTAIVKVKQKSEVLATDGVYIGGDLLNADIMQAKLWDYFGASNLWGDQKLHMPPYLYEALSSWYSIPNLNNPNTMQQFERLKYKNTDVESLNRFIYLIKVNLGFDLYEAIEKAKKELSEKDESVIKFSDGPININENITRSEFEKIIAQRVTEIRKVVLETLKKAQVEPEQIDVVIRTGGSSLIPVFEQMLADIFGREKIKQFETFTSIAAGLALN